MHDTPVSVRIHYEESVRRPEVPTIVKVFTHAALAKSPVSDSNGRGDVASLHLKHPYLGCSHIAASNVPQSSDPAAAPRGTTLARIQIEPGRTVLIEINPLQGTTGRAATLQSPWMTGDVVIAFGEGWSISVMECPILNPHIPPVYDERSAEIDGIYELLGTGKIPEMTLAEVDNGQKAS